MTYFNTILFPPIAAVRLARRVRPGQAPSRSDFGMTPEGRVNRILAGVFSSEARWLRGRDLPIGVSLLAAATAPGDVDRPRAPRLGALLASQVAHSDVGVL